jgi:hypothetical protein
MGTREFAPYREGRRDDVEAGIAVLLLVGFELGSVLFGTRSSDGRDWADPDTTSHLR